MLPGQPRPNRGETGLSPGFPQPVSIAQPLYVWVTVLGMVRVAGGPMGRPQVGPQQLISVEIPVDLLDQVRQAARAEERSVSGTVRVALREYLERRNGPAS